MAQMEDSGFKTFEIGEDVVAYRAVKFDSTAGTVSYADAGDRIDGWTQRDADDSDGDRVTVALRNKPGTQKAMLATSCSVGDKLYSAADGKLSTSVAGDAQAIALEAATADGDIIEVSALPTTGSGSALLYSNTAASSALANSNAATDFSLSHSLPANSIQAGDVYRISGSVFVSSAANNDAIAIDVEFGGVDVVEVASTNATTNDYIDFECEVFIRTIGASGTIVSRGAASVAGADGTTTLRAEGTQSTALNTQAAALIAVEGTWDVADVNSSCRLETLKIERLRK